MLAAAVAVGAAASSASRTGRRSRRTRCSSARALELRSSPRPASSICSISAARTAPTSTAVRRASRPLVPLERLPRRARADRAGRRARAARARHAAGHRRRGGRGLPAVLVPRSGPRGGDRRTSFGGVCPDAHVVASHEIAPEFREYERASTTAADAYLGPLCARYFRALASRSSAAGLPPPLVMRSSGGCHRCARRRPSIRRWSSCPGPAAGVVGASLVARQAGIENAIAFDMGGTSTDVCLIAGERCRADVRAERRRAPDPAADGRHPHGRRRRRLDRLA